MEINQQILSVETIEKLSKELDEKGISISADEDYGYEISLEILKKLMEEPVPFSLNEDGELFVEVDGETYELDPKRDKAEDVAFQEKLLISNLPDIAFD